jgi:hypothetical protein
MGIAGEVKVGTGPYDKIRNGNERAEQEEVDVGAHRRRRAGVPIELT